MISAAKPVIGAEELRAVRDVFKTGWLGMGDRVKAFENKLKAMFGRKHAICVNTGTTALHLSLDSIGIKKGDEVIVPSLTFIGTVHPILQCGARPVFCDVDLRDLNISIPFLKKLITRRTKAIVPVHYGGEPCNMDAILSIAGKKGIRVIEDAAHAFGSKYKGALIGSFGHITCFSFDPIKNITCGEGGAILLDDDKTADIIIKKRILGIDKDTWNRYQHKRSWLYEVHMKGYRYHMSNINAAIGLVQFEKFASFAKARKKIAAWYDKKLSGIKGVKLLSHDYAAIVPFNYTILADRRNELIEYLEKNGIGAVLNYIPNHLQPFFKAEKAILPNTDLAYSRIVSIPLHAGMTVSDAQRVVQAIKDFYKQQG
ncbi:MAG: DegT/DnrJ/EryC1/StrS family aminotransferase [Candidatus Omnitrophica bacterium]|nr:DegT/DnrJ/EryC1/StrS family aminotransferase [Candidatus Omnitrophota bacterium]